jgi:UDPglucose--hexose-1-phosphate uridylyltransferase
VDAGPAARHAVAAVLHRVLVGYDALFGFPLPYVLAVHQKPTCTGDWEALSHLHLELTTPHRSADRLKYLAGSELAAGAFLGDVLPETAAQALREAVA